METQTNEIMNELKEIHAKVDELDRARLATALMMEGCQTLEPIEFEPDKRIDELLAEVKALRAELKK